MPNVKRFMRGPDGESLSHLVFTMHGEGSTDGYSFGLCGADTPLVAPKGLTLDEADELPVCERCALLARGEQPPVEPYELQPGDITSEQLAAMFASDTDEVPEAVEEVAGGSDEMGAAVSSEPQAEPRPLPGE